MRLMLSQPSLAGVGAGAELGNKNSKHIQDFFAYGFCKEFFALAEQKQKL